MLCAFQVHFRLRDFFFNRIRTILLFKSAKIQTWWNMWLAQESLEKVFLIKILFVDKSVTKRVGENQVKKDVKHVPSQSRFTRFSISVCGKWSTKFYRRSDMLLKEKRERGQLSHVGSERHRIRGLLFKPCLHYGVFRPRRLGRLIVKTGFITIFVFSPYRVDILAENTKT